MNIHEEAEWLHQNDRIEFMRSDAIASPWFRAFQSKKSPREEVRWHSALVPVSEIPKLVENSHGWDIGPADGKPSTWTHYNSRGEVTERRYCPYGNESGIEPLVIYRTYNGIKCGHLELAQEFRLFHNLFHEPNKNQYLNFDSNGDDSVAVQYGDDFVKIRTDLLRQFCASKQVALGIYLESFRYSEMTLEKLGLSESRKEWKGERYNFCRAIVPEDHSLGQNRIESCSLMVGAKKYVLPDPVPSEKEDKNELYQEFIIGEDKAGNPIRHSCNPALLADYFGKNPDAPNFLTPVFFRAEVLEKYYQDPSKYSVEDGYLRCGDLWGIMIDNDHSDYLMVFLGYLGSDLSESERHYWLSYNIPCQDRKMSKTTFKRSFMAEFTDPSRPDLVFKDAYTRFCNKHREEHGWDFFLPFHADDMHCLTTLHLPVKDNQADFDRQILSLTKLLVDSLNEKAIIKGLKTIETGDKGITKLERFLTERNLSDFDPHIKFLRRLQNLRSSSAAHRKGSSYDRLVAELGLADDGQRLVFGKLLKTANGFIHYLDSQLCDNTSST